LNLFKHTSHTNKSGGPSGLTPLFFQPKLTVSQPRDIYEQEADSMADKVMRSINSPADRPGFFKPSILPVQRKCAQCEEEEKKEVHRKETSAGNDSGSSHAENYISSLDGKGRNISHSERNFFEPKFGYDFSRVQVHTDAQANESAQSLGALAYTHGSNIVFSNNQYQPDSDQGKKLMAHELTHVVQQQNSPRLHKSGLLQRQPDRSDPIHDPILDQFSAETGIPREEASQHSPEYERWLGGRTDAEIAFDNHQLRPQHLNDQMVQNRFSRMALEDLMDYRQEYIVNGANDPAVVTHITNIMLGRPIQACSPGDIQRTNQLAQAVVNNLTTIVNNADRAMTRLHSAWVNNKPDFLARRSRLAGEVACAFKSNFNIDETDPDFGVAHIRVMSRLSQLQRRITRPVSFSCEGINNSICLGGSGLDADGFVINAQDPIHLCIGFRSSTDPLHRETVIVHEFLHFLPGVDDAGGYALGGFGAQVMSCQTNSKFNAATNVLLHTADAIAGFIIHIDQTSPTDLRVV
jgi:hypothetical protein